MILRLYKYFVPFWKHIIPSLIFVLLFTFTSALLLYLATSLISSLFQMDVVQEVVQESSNQGGLGWFDSLKFSAQQFESQLFATDDKIVNLRNLAIALVIITLVKNLLFFLQGFFAAYVEQGITKTLRDKIYEHLQKLSLQYFHRSRTGNLISTAINDVFKIHETFNNTINSLIRDPISIIVYLVIMVWISWQLTLVTILIIPIISFIVNRLGKVINRYAVQAQSAIADISVVLEESINNIKIIRAYSAELHEIKRYSSHTTSYFRKMLTVNRIKLLSNPVNELLGVAAFVVVLWYGGTKVLQNSFLEPKEFLFYLFALFAIINPAKSVSTIHNKLQEGLAAAERIFNLLDTKPTVLEVANPTKIKSFADKIQFDNVFFSYDTGKEVLIDINLTVNKGEIIALVGSSGVGKSTLIDLVCRFHDPTAGKITLDGVDLRQAVVADLRGLMGIVTQETILFNDTIRYNIAYPDGNVDLERIRKAAKAANADDFIMTMPDEYDTIVGNRGMMVSGGQRQRLAIARALIRDPEILIFDEATSSLDTESEKQVQDAIDHLMQGRTTLVVAHRLSTILNADKIIVLKDGKIIEQGKHEELLEVNGVYRRLHDLQFGKEYADNT